MTAAAIFDLDGTLIDSLPTIASAANALLATEGLPALPAAQVAGFVGLGERVFLDRLIAATDLDAAQYDALLARFMPLYVAASESGSHLFDGVAEALNALAARGVPLGLVTNKPGGPTEAVLRSLGWHDRFGMVVAGDTLPLRKPDPAPLHHAMQALGVGRALYVGDSVVDAKTAQAAGQPFALYTEGIRTDAVEDLPHDAAFDDFAQLVEIYTRLAGA